MNVSAENVNQVISNITEIITTANETADQSSDNLRVISDVLMQSVDIILTQNVSVEVANQVNNELTSIHHLLVSISNIFSIILQVTINTIDILDNVEEWPMEILQQQSNM